MSNNFRDDGGSVVSGIGRVSVIKKSTDTGGVHVPHVNVDTMPAVAVNTLPAYGSYSATRTTSAVSIGAVGAAGDFLHRVEVTSVVGAADLTISDGAGVVVAVIPASSAAGYSKEVNVAAATGGFVVDLHATAVGTITAIGTFT